MPELLTQPLQVVVGGRRGNTGQYESGERLFDLAPTTEKDLFVVEGPVTTTCTTNPST